MLTDERIRQCWYSNGSTMPSDGMYRQCAFARSIEAAVLEEAAKLCDRFADREMHPAECAEAIRAMKEKP